MDSSRADRLTNIFEDMVHFYNKYHGFGDEEYLIEPEYMYDGLKWTLTIRR